MQYHEGTAVEVTLPTLAGLDRDSFALALALIPRLPWINAGIVDFLTPCDAFLHLDVSNIGFLDFHAASAALAALGYLK